MLQRVRHILSVMCVILPLAALALILQGQHAGSAASTQLFVSKLPTPTPAATATPAVPGLFISPLSTPAGMTIQARLPLVYRQPTPTPTATPTPIKYGWKGVGQTGEAEALGANHDNGFWGVNPAWWYDWGYTRVGEAGIASPEEIVNHMAAALATPSYVPMVWWTSDVSIAVAPEAIATLAADHPGRVWLMFNEPDNDGSRESCGFWIKEKHSDYYHPDHPDWIGLGSYLADEYALYAIAILNADPTARIFTFATMQLPMPTLTVPTNPNDPYKQRAIPIWQGFLNRMASQYPDVPIDGIAIHAYPNNFSTYHTGPTTACQQDMFLDPGCAQRAIEDAYRFFQGFSSLNPQPGLTQNKPIWLTETGVLTVHTQLAWNSVKTGYQTPLMNWLTPRMAPTAQPCCAWINAVAWFSTHQPLFTASNLLVPTPAAPPALGALTPLGTAWRDMACDSCACPGYDCQ